MPIRKTKQLDKMLRRYDVTLRPQESVVRHVLTGKTTICDPLTFAVFEAAIKAIYLSNSLHPMWPELCEAGHNRHYQTIARLHGFDLPNAARVPKQHWQREGEQAAKDYHYCVSLIGRAGLYHRLLD